MQYMEDPNCSSEPFSNDACNFADFSDFNWHAIVYQMYYGRGPIGLKENKHYALFSRAWYQDRHEGDLVLRNDAASILDDPV